METQTIVAVLACISLYYIPSIWRTFVFNRKLRSIPTIGPSGTFSSYIGALRFLWDGNNMLQEGYDKFRGSIFRVPTLTSWMIVASGDNLIDEMRRAPDDVLSASEAFRESIFVHLTVGPELTDNPFHVEAIRRLLTRNIGPKFADVHNEIVEVFDEYIPAKGDEWIEITAYSTIMDIVCRTSHRILVGLPLCRNPDWMDVNKKLTMEIAKSAIILGLFPGSLRPFVARLLRGVPNMVRRGTKLVEPLIKERLEAEAEDGKERPNDMITWFLDVTKDRQRNITTLAKGMLITNFAALNSTTRSFTLIMYELATRPEYVQPLHDEVKAAIEKEGWTKNAVSKMWKVDSFIKECMRVSHFRLLSTGRKALKDFTFSDGTTVPAGSFVTSPFSSVHMDADNYTDPNTFDGFRFEKLRMQEGEGSKHQFVSLDLDYLLFGHGRHACPGRFFVANEMKAMLAYILLNYDFKMADGRGRPKTKQVGIFMTADTKAKLLFRKRREVN